MPRSVAIRVARTLRSGVCAAIAVALGLACTVLTVAASSAPMTGMTVTSATAGVTAPARTLEAEAKGLAGAVGVVVGEAARPVALVDSPVMSSMCDGTCVSGVGAVCATAAGLAVITLLGLLLASRRDTYLGLLSRERPPARVRRRRLRPPWTVLSPVSLCVLRV